MDQSRISLLQSQPVSVAKSKKYVYMLTFFGGIGGFLFGYDTGVVSGAMIILKHQFSLNNLWQEILVSITIGFAAVFAILGGWLNSLIGRKGSTWTASVLFIAGSVVLSLAQNKETLLVGRAIVGIGIGIASMTVPVYIAEIAPADIRGRLVTVNNVMITFGQFVASCIDGIFSADPVNGWRWMLGLAAVPAFIQLIGFLFLPESPRWLISKGRDKKAMESLIKVIGNKTDAQKEYDSVKGGIECEQHNASESIMKIMCDPPVRRALVVGCGLQMFQQLSGINTVMYYSATIVQMSGVKDERLTIWLAAVTSFVNFIFTLFGVWLVEKVGRRLLTLASIAGVVFALLFLSLGFYLAALHSPPVTAHDSSLNETSCGAYKSCVDCMQSIECGFCYMEEVHSGLTYNTTCLPVNTTDTQVSAEGRCSNVPSDTNGPYFAYNYCPTAYSWMALCGMILYLAFFAPGMGPMPWTVNSEIYPQWARNTATSCSTGVNWVFNLAVSLTFLNVTEALTYQGAFLLYALLSFSGFVFLLLLLPETKGKQLEEIENIFRSGWLVPFRTRYSYDQVSNSSGERSEHEDSFEDQHATC